MHNYLLYDVGHAALRPWRAMAEAAKLCFGNPFNPVAHTTFGRGVTAACELFERTTRC
jgi:poly(3-hydroxybutyrate) depolymerase